MAPATGAAPAIVGLVNSGYSPSSYAASLTNVGDPVRSSALPQMVQANIAALAIGGFVSFALIVWDFITYLPDEIRLLKDFRKVSWRSPDPFCFLAVRYTALAYALTALFTLALKTPACQTVISLSQVFSIFVLISAAILAAKRTTSLWVRNKYTLVLGVTGTLGVFMLASWIAVSTQHRAFQVPEYVDFYQGPQANLPAFGTNCGLNLLPSWHPISYIASTLFFGSTFFLALVRWCRQRTERVLNLGLTPLNRACLWYLLVSFIASLALLVVYGSAGAAWSNDVARRVSQPFFVLLIAGMAQRLYLNSQADYKLRKEHIAEMARQELKPKIPQWSWSANVARARSRSISATNSPIIGAYGAAAPFQTGGPGSLKKNSVSTIGSASTSSPKVPVLNFGSGPNVYPRPPPPPLPTSESPVISPLPPQHLMSLEKKGSGKPGSRDGGMGSGFGPRRGSEGSLKEKGVDGNSKANDKLGNVKEENEKDIDEKKAFDQTHKSAFYSTTTADDTPNSAGSPSSLPYINSPGGNSMSDYALTPVPNSSASGQFLHLTPTTISHYPLSSLSSPNEGLKGLKNFKFSPTTASSPANSNAQYMAYSGEGIDPLSPLPTSPNGGQYATAPSLAPPPAYTMHTHTHSNSGSTSHATPPNHTCTPDVPSDSPASPTSPISPGPLTGTTTNLESESQSMAMFSPVSTIGFGSPPGSPPVLSMPWPGGKPPSGGKKVLPGSTLGGGQSAKAMALLGQTGPSGRLTAGHPGKSVRKVGSKGSMRRGRGAAVNARIGRSVAASDIKRYGSFRSGWND